MDKQTTQRKNSRAVQARALADIGGGKRRSAADEIEDIVRAAMRNGLDGLTRSEIRVRWEALSNGKRREEAAVAARVVELIKSKRLVQLEQQKVCTVSGTVKTQVAAPEQQVKLLP